MDATLPGSKFQFADASGCSLISVVTELSRFWYARDIQFDSREV